jgi:hypothetical protein
MKSFVSLSSLIITSHVESLDLGIKFGTRIVAGSMGMTIKGHKAKDGGTIVQPCSGFWMLEYGRERLTG